MSHLFLSQNQRNTCITDEEFILSIEVCTVYSDRVVQCFLKANPRTDMTRRCAYVISGKDVIFFRDIAERTSVGTKLYVNAQ